MTDSTPKNALPIEDTENIDVSKTDSVISVPKNETDARFICLDYSSFSMNTESFLRDMEREAISSMLRIVNTRENPSYLHHNLASVAVPEKTLKPVPASLWEQLAEDYSPRGEEKEEDSNDNDIPDHIPSFSNEDDEGDDDVPPLTDDIGEDDTSKNFKEIFDTLYRMRSELASKEGRGVMTPIEKQLHEKRRRAMIIAHNAVLRESNRTPEDFNREVFEENAKRMMQELEEEQERVQGKVQEGSMSLLYEGVYPDYEMSNIVQATGRARRSTSSFNRD